MNDIEYKFLKTFGIKFYFDWGKVRVIVDNEVICDNKRIVEKDCPSPITDRILLELICIVSNFYMDYELPIHLKNIEALKECILNSLICIEQNAKTKDVYKQVQSLFTEGESEN